jgi:hypothetical protein
VKSESTHGTLWRQWHPKEVACLLEAAGAPWWIAGGWAIDLFCGATTRQHADLDVGILRVDVPSVRQAISTWQVFEAKDGRLTRLGSGRLPRREVHCLWCRPTGADRWAIELMLDEGDREMWVYRRNRAIRRSMSAAVRQTADGLPYLAPEIELLYKSKTPRDRDEMDFERTWRVLSVESRRWLHDAISLTDPRHPWLTSTTRSAARGRARGRAPTSPR